MREISRIRRQLNRENKNILGKVVNYIYANGVNTIVWKEIRLDLAGMLLENQKRGEDPEAVIGSDYKAFSDDLIENCPRKKPIDMIVEILFIIGMSVSIIVPLIYFFGHLTPSIDHYVERGIYYVTPRSFSLLLAGAFGGGIGSFASHKYAFNKKSMVIYIVLYLLSYVIVSVVVSYYLRQNMTHDHILSMDMVKLESWALLMSAALFAVRTLRTRIQIRNFKKSEI
ncbi:DUF1129 domain-containing protein [Fusibacter ferrireducens]|uniref:Uncharacterized protein n=1 Tax=Fusibacter ferrireducens TaxID=2785058 RepID=A0ABS0A062_9FIRM|nr:hypothetical protein [Fusibacter ferrireducens]MBF4695808.1 hypothetical protein [Fusibacter ferrireducens]